MISKYPVEANSPIRTVSKAGGCGYLRILPKKEVEFKACIFFWSEQVHNATRFWLDCVLEKRRKKSCGCCCPKLWLLCSVYVLGFHKISLNKSVWRLDDKTVSAIREILSKKNYLKPGPEVWQNLKRRDTVLVEQRRKIQRWAPKKKRAQCLDLVSSCLSIGLLSSLVSQDGELVRGGECVRDAGGKKVKKRKGKRLFVWCLSAAQKKKKSSSGLCLPRHPCSDEGFSRAYPHWVAWRSAYLPACPWILSCRPFSSPPGAMPLPGQLEPFFWPLAWSGAELAETRETKSKLKSIAATKRGRALRNRKGDGSGCHVLLRNSPRRIQSACYTLFFSIADHWVYQMWGGFGGLVCGGKVWCWKWDMCWLFLPMQSTFWSFWGFLFMPPLFYCFANPSDHDRTGQKEQGNVLCGPAVSMWPPCSGEWLQAYN